MRRYFRHILLSLISVICTVSCIKELDDPNPVHVSDTPTVLVPRVKSFTNQYITKAGYTTDETQISSLTVLVFNNNGQLVHIQQPSNLSSIELNKSMLDAPGQEVTAATIVMIANVGLDKITDGNGNTFQEIKANKLALTLEGMENCTFDFSANPVITSISDNFTGFPMIGGVKNVNLSATKESQNTISVPLKILYAKINFFISVANGTENTGTDMQFTLNEYSVHNVANKTGVAIPTEQGEPVIDFLGEIINEDDKAENDGATDSSDYSESGVTGSKTGTTNVSGQPITFTFYIAESRYNHNSDLKGIYPSDDWLTTDDTQDGQVKNGVKSFYDDLIQQYKPKLASVSTGKPAAGLASYVLLSGTYVDYRGTSWNVNYTVYLGKDNAQNFHVDRNSEYTNYITIKGIRNNSSFGGDNQEVWVDHRVNVTDASGAANHVTITRETLIDSHIEVRPLRVKWPENEYVGVRVYLPTDDDGSLVDWIGIERFTGENNREGTVYCYQGNQSTGKRKYFTTTLISELQSKEGEFGVRDDNGRKYVYLLNGECAWIYFDENNTTLQREANIDLEFYPESGSTTTARYVVKQHGLQAVGGYKVESYEEYLHSYDSEDKYNLSTSPADYTQQGLQWGFVKETISEDIIVSATQLEGLGIGIQDYVGQRYDYFHKSDIPSGDTYYPYMKNGDDWVTAPYGTGLIFTDRASVKKDVTIKDMGTIPDNAYQYCLSKNKFKEDPDGNHTLDIHWYLPDVYELQAVLNANQSAEDFGADSYYWSSQPAEDGLSIDILGYELSIKNEDGDNARAVSKSGKADLDRSAQHRIRCFYDATGITADMSDRAPDGVGGNYNFYMKAYNGNAAAYFNYMLSNATTSTDNSTTSYENKSYAYPTFANPGSEFEYFSGAVDQNGNSVQGFGKNPAAQANWAEYTLPIVGTQTGYYTTLATYPGLTMYTLDKYTLVEAYKPTTTRKSETKIESSKTRKSLQSSLPTVSLNTLDHLTNGDMLKISFSNDKNASNSPVFTFSELVSGSKEVTTTRYWQVPTYEEGKYTPKPINTSIIVNDIEGDEASSYLAQIAKTQAEYEAKDAAYQAAKIDANTKYPGHTEISVSYSNLSLVSGYPKTVNRRDTYKYKCTCTLTISVSGEEQTYYKDATGGGWDNGTSVTKTVDGIETDELRMYCGNSFTISLADAYKNDFEITKVKVYFSGDNHVASPGTGDNVYARFIESSITLPQEKTISKQGSTETLQLPGMDFSDDTEAGTGSHQWTGEGKQSVTLSLVDYYVMNNLLDNSYTYRYAAASQGLSKYIVIDRIEVKCTPKSK